MAGRVGAVIAVGAMLVGCGSVPVATTTPTRTATPVGSIAWSIASTPLGNPNAVPDGNGEFYGVACESADDCWAVGNYETGRVLNQLIEQYTGGRWSIVPGPTPEQTRGRDVRQRQRLLGSWKHVWRRRLPTPDRAEYG
jgi:hypothetical protein